MAGIAGVLAVPAVADWNPAKVKGYKACVKCHENQVKVWEDSKHFKGFKELTKNEKAGKIAEALGISASRIKKEPLCSGCHFTLQDEGGSVKPISGVSCESCHGPSADWLEVHNDFGGKGVKREFEPPQHRDERFAKMDQAGMNFPGNIYGFAKNCYQCHIVGSEDLVNKTEHAPGSDFDLVKRSQGSIRHGKPASAETKRKLQVMGYAVELELSLRALAKAKGGKYAQKMQERAMKAYANLKDISQKAPQADVKAMLTAAGSGNFAPGGGILNQAADGIRMAALRFSKQEDGKGLAALDSRQPIGGGKAAPVAEADAPPEKANKEKDKVKPKEAVPPVDEKPSPKVAKASPDEKPSAKLETKPEVADNPIAKPTAKPEPQAVAPEPIVKVTPPLAPTKPPARVQGGALIGSFEIVAPNSSKLCQNRNPYLAGERKISANERLQADGCFTLRVVAGRPASLYVFSQSEDGTTIQLLPNACKALGVSSNQVTQGQRLNLPQNELRQPLAIGLDENKGVEWFYLVAVDGAAAEAGLRQQLGDIPDVCQTDSAPPAKKDVAQFKNSLTELQTQHPGTLQFESRSFIHD